MLESTSVCSCGDEYVTGTLCHITYFSVQLPVVDIRSTLKRNVVAVELHCHLYRKILSLNELSVIYANRNNDRVPTHP